MSNHTSTEHLEINDVTPITPQAPFSMVRSSLNKTYSVRTIVTVSMSTTKATTKDTKALPLADTLRDLALLRASDVDLTALLPSNAKQDSLHVVGEDKGSLEDSSEFIKEARKALKVHDRGEIEAQGKKLEEVSEKYEALLAGLTERPDR